MMRVLKRNRVVTICKIAGLVLLLSGILNQALAQQDPRYDVAEYVRDNVLGGEYGNRTIWISAWPVDSSHEARSLDPTEPTLELPYEGWMVMIDDVPQANFAHDVRWLFVRIDLGEHTTPQAYTMAPRVFDEENNEVPVSCLEGATEVPCPQLEPIFPGPMIAIDSLLAFQATAEEECLHAVLISGGAYPNKNFERYRTNLRSMYSILLSQGYPKSNIYVYYADGDPLDLDDADGDGNDSTGSDVTDSADEATIRARIRDLCDDLDPVTDYLFVYVSNHGMANGAICLYDFDSSGSLEADEQYSPAEMGADTEDCQVCRLFMLHDQCFSGAFLPLATDGDHDNTTVYAAATDSESSWGREYLDWWEDLDHANYTLEDLHQDVVDNGGLSSTPGKDEVDEANDQVKLGDCCENAPPIANANGPYVAECDGANTTVSLDGTGSSDPNPGDVLSYSWTTDCTGTFDDASSPTPLLTIDSSTQSVSCNVTLTVTDSFGTNDIDSSTVTIGDTTPPSITCPPDTIVECDESSDPGNTGEASATDVCDSMPTITYSDAVSPGSCPEESTITRTWTATDASGNSSSCVQTIEVVDTTPPEIECNAPATITPNDTPISFIGTATDNCAGVTTVEIISYDCFFLTKKGKRIDKTESCVVEVEGETITVVDSGGVDDNITWSIRASDNCGNVEESVCSLVVVNPGEK